MSSTGIAAGAVATELLQLIQQGIGTTIPLLKKSMQADKDMVTALLPTPSSESGRVNISA